MKKGTHSFIFHAPPTAPLAAVLLLWMLSACGQTTLSPTPPQNDGGNLEDTGQQVADGGQQAKDGGQQAKDAGQQAKDAGQQVADAGQQTKDAGQQVADAGQQVADAGQQVADAGQQVADAGLQTKDTAGNTGVQCQGKEQSFPTFDKSCSMDSDCVTAKHQVSCCMSFIAVGMNKNALAGFSASEKICRAQYPDCECIAPYDLSENGIPIVAPGKLEARCEAGLCIAKVIISSKECKKLSFDAPKPWTWCQKNSDCATVKHLVDCCGSVTMWGVAKTSKAAIEASEKACNKIESICDCMVKPATADDGKPISKGKLSVECVYGKCRSLVL